MKYFHSKVGWLLVGIQVAIQAGPVITNMAPFMSRNVLQIGDALSSYALAKILSMKYNIPFCYSHFEYDDLFAFSDRELSDRTEPIWASGRKRIMISTEQDVIQNLNNDVIMYTGLQTKIDYVESAWYQEIKKDIQLKDVPAGCQLSHRCITVGMHIRKGNGGGQFYDGQLLSEQEFDFDRSEVQYDTEFESFPFDWQGYQRRGGNLIKDFGFVAPFFNSVVAFFENLFDKIEDLVDGKDDCDHHHKPQQHGNHHNNHHKAPVLSDDKNNYLDAISYVATKFPPTQYYIDALCKLSSDLSDIPLLVYVCTDDRNPDALMASLRKGVNKSNITFMYKNDHHMSYRERITRDLCTLSQTDVLIRSQSGFSRVAQMMGNHKMVIYPLDYRWQENKLLMTHVVMSGSIENLLQSNKSFSTWDNLKTFFCSKLLM